MQHLTEQFLIDLFKLCFIKKDVMDIVSLHLKFHFIPDKLIHYKKILKSIVTYYNNNNSLPSYGVISQQHKEDKDVQETIFNIKESERTDQDQVISLLDRYIREASFQEIFLKTKELYNDDKQDEAIQFISEESQKLNSFSIYKGSSKFLKLFADFGNQNDQRVEHRESGDFLPEIIPMGIDPLDAEMEGGIDKTDTVLVIARSGVGKSTILKSIAVHMMRLGYDGIHFQFEGSKQECYDKYTQVWTAQKYFNIKTGNISRSDLQNFKQIAQEMKARQKDLSIYAFEEFEEATMKDVYLLTQEWIKIHQKFPDFIVLDSIDLVLPGDGLRYGVDTQSVKMRIQNSSRKLKNICNEFGCRGITATQTSDLPKSLWNDPEFIIDRSHTEADKTLVKSYSYVFSLNQTLDEYNKDLMRIGIDKLRHNKIVNRVIPIATAYNSGRSYDRKRSKEIYGYK